MKLKTDEFLKNMIPESEVPQKKSRIGAWLKLALAIPKGKAIALTKAEIEVDPSSVQGAIIRYKRLGLLPPDYYVTSRVIDGVKTVYIVHGETEKE